MSDSAHRGTGPARAALERAAEAFAADSIRWSVCVLDPADATTPLLAIGVQRMLRTASVPKILPLIEAARAIEAGELDPDEMLDRRACERIADSGIWQHLSIDQLSAADVARLVGLASDNWATNVLLQRLGGVDAVAATAAGFGLDGVTLHDRVRNQRTSQHPPTLSEASAAGLARLLYRLVSAHEHPPTPPAHTAAPDIPASIAHRVLGWLRGGLDLSMVAAPLGLDPLAHSEPDRGLTLINKTGTDAGVRADVGYLTGPSDRLIYACIANWNAPADPTRDPTRDEALAAMHQLGRALNEVVATRGAASA